MLRTKKRAPILLPPGAGRAYARGLVHAVFKADGDETRGRYSISEWWLEPYTRGPGAHMHEEDDDPGRSTSATRSSGATAAVPPDLTT